MRSMVLFLAVVGMAWISQAAHGEDFRVRTRLFAEGKAEAMSENTTYFRGGVVYDFLPDAEDANHVLISVFEPGKSRFRMLDTARRQMTEIKTDAIADHNDELRKRYQTSGDPFLQFLGDPKFEEELRADDSTLILSGEFLRYEIEFEAPPGDAAASQYAEFSDWYARLNTFANAGALLPQARLEVNARLRDLGVAPRIVRLRRESPDGVGAKEVRLRTEHEFTWELGEDDLSKISEAQRYSTKFEMVSPKDLLKGENNRPRVASGKQDSR